MIKKKNFFFVGIDRSKRLFKKFFRDNFFFLGTNFLNFFVIKIRKIPLAKNYSKITFNKNYAKILCVIFFLFLVISNFNTYYTCLRCFGPTLTSAVLSLHLRCLSCLEPTFTSAV